MREPDPEFVLRLVPTAGTDPIRALRWGLKTLLRRYGLRCVAVQEYRAPHVEPVRPPVKNRHGNRREHRPQPARDIPRTCRRDAKISPG
jgi:hypothetical protein